MKRFIAVCLLVICVALPIIGVAANCFSCGAPGAYLSTNNTTIESYNSSTHTILKYDYTVCNVCQTIHIRVKTRTTVPHSIQHSKQWVTSTLTYEYDYCTVCDYKSPGTTIHH